MNYAVILAGGTGSRVGAGVPKQMLVLGGRRVLEHSVGTFDDHPQIARVVIVVHPSVAEIVAEIVRRHRAQGEWLKVELPVEGGSSRALSTLAGIRAVERLAGEAGDTGPAVLFHDAARPLVSSALISRVCGALPHSGAVNVGLPVTDTIMEHDGPWQTATPDRNRLLRVQTPQAFRLSLIAEAYRRAMADPAFTATDDCGILMRYLPDTPVYIVEGEERNAKLTYATDIPLFESWMEQA